MKTIKLSVLSLLNKKKADQKFGQLKSFWIDQNKFGLSKILRVDKGLGVKEAAMKDFLRKYISNEIKAILQIDFEDEYELENYFMNTYKVDNMYIPDKDDMNMLNELKKAWHERERERLCNYFAKRICHGLELSLEDLDEIEDYTEEEKNFLKKIFKEEEGNRR